MYGVQRRLVISRMCFFFIDSSQSPEPSCSHLRGQNVQNFKRLSKLYGPSARVVISASTGERQVARKIMNSATCMGPDISSTLIHGVDKTKRSYPSPVIYVCSGNSERDMPQPFLPTKFIMSVFIERLMVLEEQSQIESLAAMGSASPSRSLTGWLFEAWVHIHFRSTSRPFTCVLVPHQSLTPGSPSRSTPPRSARPTSTRSYSALSTPAQLTTTSSRKSPRIANAAITKLRLYSTNRPLTQRSQKSSLRPASVRPLYSIRLYANGNQKLRVTELSKVQDLLSISPVGDFYWQPTATDYKGVDALLFTDNTLFLIQATLAWHDREINGGWEIVKPFVDDAARRYRIVFIYVVDDAVKGQELCLREHDKGFEVGYVDVSAELPDSLKTLQVRDYIELALAIVYSPSFHSLFLYARMPRVHYPWQETVNWLPPTRFQTKTSWRKRWPQSLSYTLRVRRYDHCP